MERLRNRHSFRGFTLVEIMVAVAVLAIVLVSTSAIVGAVSRNIGVSGQGLDTALRAKQLFQRIGLDMAARVRRPDVQAMGTNGPSEFLSFISDVPALGSPNASAFFSNGVGEPAMVFYRLATNSGSVDPSLAGWSEVQRAVVGVYSGDHFGFDASTNRATMTPANGTGGDWGSGDFDPLVVGVVKVAVGYLSENGTYSPADGGQLDDQRSLVVSVVMADEKVRQRADPAVFEKAASAFPDPATGTNTALAQWNEVWSGGPASDVPPHVWNALRIYEHTFPTR